MHCVYHIIQPCFPPYRLLGFSPNPNWTNSKRLAVIDANLTVTVVNFETGEATHGHRAHETGELRDKSKKVTAAIVFLQQNAVVSSVRSTVAHYCLNTNKYRLYFDFTQPGNPFSIFRQSPKDPDLLAGGTKDGLVVIISLGKMQVIRKFRGHDKEISSMDWRYLSLRSPVEDGKAKTLEQDISLTDPTDAFDLYDHSEAAEFGVYGGSSVANKSDDKEDNNRSLQEKLVSDEGFDFSEACRSVKRDLEASQNKLKDNGSGMPPCTFYGGGDQSKTTFEDNKDKYGVRNPNEDASDNDSLLSNASSNTPDLTEESLNDEAAGPSKDKVPEDQIPVLATGSKEHHANVWDVLSDEVQPMVTMKWNSKTKSPFPEAYTNIMFLRDNVILIGNGFGEIEEYKIEFNPTTRKIVVKEKKAKNFDVKAVLSMAPSAGGDILWTSSIYRNISCFDIPRNYAKIVSLDTIQPRIHCITPNPHDPNILAVGGCDNRVCLWNTSEVQSHTIKMRPFMTKIRAALLCIAWHPDLEQLVAFSTKEGRVATLDTSRPNNVPKPLKHYTNGDVYSITWAKLQGSPILICAHNKELVFYSFTTACGKSEVTKHSVADIVCVTSLVASGNVLVVGTGDGRLIIVDINNRFNILDERILTEAKYIGMMEWFEDALAVATDHDIYMVRNIKKNIGLSRDPTGEQDIALLPNQHTQRINSVSFNRTGNLLISTCNGGLVKILDVDKEPGFEETIATINLGSPAFCAIFLPSNQDLVVCGGQDCTPTIFKWEDFRGNEEKPLPKKKADPHRKVHWARQSEAANKGDKKLKVRVEDVEQSFGNMQLDPPTSSAVSVTGPEAKTLTQFFPSSHSQAHVSQHQRRKPLFLISSTRKSSTVDCIWSAAFSRTPITPRASSRRCSPAAKASSR